MDPCPVHAPRAQVVPAQYAFVVHTADPLTGERGRIFGEVVVGMGEALVGNFPGRALSFTLPSQVRPACQCRPYMGTPPSLPLGPMS